MDPKNNKIKQVLSNNIFIIIKNSIVRYSLNYILLKDFFLSTYRNDLEKILEPIIDINLLKNHKNIHKKKIIKIFIQDSEFLILILLNYLLYFFAKIILS